MTGKKRGKKARYPIPPLVDRPLIENHRSNFGAPLKIQTPNPHDAAFWSAVTILEKFNRQDFAHFADPLCIEALSITPSVFKQYESSPVVHVLCRHELFIKVQLKLTWGTLVVLDDGAWIPFLVWLKTVQQPSLLLRSGMSGYREQYRWWKFMTRTVGKQFRLLDLPAELQSRILLLAIGERIEPQNTGGPLMTGGDLSQAFNLLDGTRDFWHNAVDFRTPGASKSRIVSPGNKSALKLSRQTRSIGTEALLKDTTKVFRSVNNGAMSTIQRSLVAHYMDKLRRVEFILSYREAIDVFKVEIPPFKHFPGFQDAPDAANFVKNLPNLKFVELVFCSGPFAEYYPDDRVGPFKSLNADEESILERFPEINTFYEPCVKTLVEHIMPFIAGYVQHVPTVELSGRIKTSTKTKWEGILNDKSLHDYTQELEEKREVVRRLPNIAFPPACDCPRICGFGYADEYLDPDDLEPYKAGSRGH